MLMLAMVVEMCWWKCVSGDVVVSSSGSTGGVAVRSSCSGGGGVHCIEHAYSFSAPFTHVKGSDVSICVSFCIYV